MKKMSAIVVSSFLIMHTQSIPCVLSRISQPSARLIVMMLNTQRLKYSRDSGNYFHYPSTTFFEKERGIGSGPR